MTDTTGAAAGVPADHEGTGGDDAPLGGDETYDAPLGGDETTEEQLEADNPVEEDTLKTLDPNDSPA